MTGFAREELRAGAPEILLGPAVIPQRLASLGLRPRTRVLGLAGTLLCLIRTAFGSSRD